MFGEIERLRKHRGEGKDNPISNKLGKREKSALLTISHLDCSLTQLLTNSKRKKCN